MSCLTLSYANKIPSCAQEIVIGTILFPDEDVYVFIDNQITGRSVRYDTTSDALGVVRLDTSEIEFDEEFTYEVYITLQSDESIMRELIEIGSVSSTNWVLTFFELMSDTGQKVEYPSVTLTYCQS